MTSVPDPTAIVSGATNNDDDDRQAEDEEGEADEEGSEEGDVDAEEDTHAIAVYCKECQTWLNGPRQWEDHKIGKKHRKNVQKARRGAAASSNDVPAVQADETNPRPDPVPNILTDTWLWLENAKAEKEALKKTENEVEADKVEKSSRAARRRRYKKERQELDSCDIEKNVREASEEGLESDIHVDRDLAHANV